MQIYGKNLNLTKSLLRRKMLKHCFLAFNTCKALIMNKEKFP